VKGFRGDRNGGPADIKKSNSSSRTEHYLKEDL